ncbi:hypothetical protein BN946_scf184842.g9 [Trametes cinnabarina]|uniref:Uncharacterized protein n=1 Tax=Pycnoporus cinnabarinus TaxID=5643 RepID=A0A060S257_PYCCI|nr:hypothetical protein BN946_scf184842.g9 [Trametes cinnabarina]
MFAENIVSACMDVDARTPSGESDQIDQLDESTFAAPVILHPSKGASNHARGRAAEDDPARLARLFEVFADVSGPPLIFTGCRICVSQKRRCSWGGIGPRGEVYAIVAKTGPKTKALARFNGYDFGIIKRVENDWPAIFEAVESATHFIVAQGGVVLDAAALAAKTSDCHVRGAHPTEWPVFVLLLFSRAFAIVRHHRGLAMARIYYILHWLPWHRRNMQKGLTMCRVPSIRPMLMLETKKTTPGGCRLTCLTARTFDLSEVPPPAHHAVELEPGPATRKSTFATVKDAIPERAPSIAVPYIELRSFPRAPHRATNSGHIPRRMSRLPATSVPSPHLDGRRSPERATQDAAMRKSEDSEGTTCDVVSVKTGTPPAPARASGRYVSATGSADRHALLGELKILQEEHASLRSRRTIIQAQLEALEAREAELLALLSESKKEIVTSRAFSPL